MPELFDNINNKVVDDLKVTISSECKLCIADSIGLGKTFSALSVFKYCEERNKSVLYLKKLYDNWITYKSNYINIQNVRYLVELPVSMDYLT